MAHFESKAEMAEEKTCAVVTGGRGFAARHLVEMLIKSQHKKWLVRIADLAPSIKLDPHEEDGILGNALRSGHAIYVSADLRHKAQVIQGFFLNPRFQYEEGFVYSDNIRSGVTKVIERLAPNVTFAIEATREIAQFRGKIGRFGDLTAQTAVGIMNPAFEGAEVVFHMAAPDSSINNYQLHHSVNVQGTENVIAACIACKVKRLIYTSSPSVVFDGIHGIYNGDESLPYPNTYNDSYSATKAQAEALVIQSNGKGGLLTCCIRPSTIFGPGDKLLVPSLAAAARAGKSKFIIGDGNNMYDFTYVENVAHAHICAEQTLASGIAEGMAAGKAFFITNMEPIKFWEFVSLILEGLGYERPRIRIPVPFLMPIAHVVEWTYKMAAPLGMRVPQLTPSRVRLLSCSRTFNCTRAKNELGYTPIVSLQEGLERTIQSYSFLRADQPTEGSTARGLPSKASTYLGGGKVAYILLWKDKKQTLSILLSLFAVYFYTSGYTFITAVSKLLLTVTVVLFVHSILPAKILDYRLEKIPNSYFQFSEETMHHIALSMRAAWNSAAQILDSLRRGKDWILFIKVVVVLSLINLIGEMPLQTLYLTGVFFIFTAFYLYDRREAEIDDLIQRAKSMLSLTVNQPAAAH